MNESTVDVEVQGRILIITINRPARRNAIDRATAEGIDRALNRLDDDPDLWCGVLTGQREFSRPGVTSTPSAIT